MERNSANPGLKPPFGAETGPARGKTKEPKRKSPAPILYGRGGRAYSATAVRSRLVLKAASQQKSVKME